MMSGAALADLVERDFVAAWWTLAEGADAERNDDGRLRWYRSGLPDPYGNAVLVTHVAEDEADATIDTMLDHLRDRGSPGYWWVMPSARPADLSDRLQRRGLVPENAWRGMAVAVDDLSDPPSVAGLEIRRVADATDFAAYVTVFAPILSPSPAFTEFFARAATGIGFEEGAPEEHFLGLLDGRPVATTSLLTVGGAAGIYNVTVVPEARGRGIGAAITAAAIRHGAEHGLTVSTLQASTMGRPVYERLGFRFVVDLVPFRWSPA